MVVISGNQRLDGHEKRSPAASGAALERRSLALLWKRPLEVLAPFVVAVLSQLNRGDLYPYAHASLAASRTCAIRAKMQPPAFLRHGTENGKAGYSPKRPWWSSRTQNMNNEGG